MIFSTQEMSRRWAEVQRRLGDAECAVAPSFHNSYYLSGVPVIRYGRWAITVLFRDANPVLVLPEFEESAARRQSPIADIRTYRDEDGPTDRVSTGHVVDALRGKKPQFIGIEGGGMPATMYWQLRDEFPDASFQDVTMAVDEVRLVSSAEEIAYLRDSTRIADVGMASVLERVNGSVTEASLSADAIVSMQREGTPEAVVTNSTCYIQQGSRSIEGHGRSMNIPVERGGILEVVCEAEVWHYMAGVERALIIGEVSDEVKRAYDAALEAFHAARDAVRPGATFGEVHKTAHDVFDRAGYGDRVIMGSGLVRSILTTEGGRIESGNFRLYNDRPLAPGMVLSIEPWAAVPGIGGQRHCDMVLVTEEGHEVLSTTDAGPLLVA